MDESQYDDVIKQSSIAQQISFALHCSERDRGLGGHEEMYSRQYQYCEALRSYGHRQETKEIFRSQCIVAVSS